MKIFSVSLCAALAGSLLVGCGGNGFSRPDTTGCEVSLRVRPFYQDMMRPSGETTGERTSRLVRDYGDYYSTFCRDEIRIGAPGSATYEDGVLRFLSNPDNEDVLPKCDSVFASLRIDSDVSDAFSCFHALFPSAPVPSDVFCHFCGFNDVIFVDSTFVSFAIEHYLGAECPFYEWIQIPVYARQVKDSRFLASDLLRAWIFATLPDVSTKDDVLSAMVYQGKVIYAAMRCMPDADEALMFGYAPEQMQWCRVNEGRMWAYLAEHKLLFSTNALDRNKIVNAAPFTFFFGNNSPGRAALYCGYRMVRQFMDENPQVTLPELFAISDAQRILMGAAYNPK